MKKSNNIISEIAKTIPLETRIVVDIQAYFIELYGGTYFQEMDKNGKDIVNENNKMAFEKAKPLIDSVLETISEWKRDINLNK